ncbi:phosphatase PAP2 family protein [Gordonia sp. (in: high G+C Gram-positive bacteria)]|uniref:phosphatase PAP2 family protein n=1 Tax=Gordonia sp. (in: high G+C Gram-positive bacteria) TaxID=84139 RepID=UPI002623A158|nr:phosphatase PAP2 family protein [Gordonia sp. (in: high G+C Gram-positive bacteria)]
MAAGRARWAVLAVGALTVLIGVYWAAVRTYTGQRVENAALRGSYQINADQVTAADNALATLTVGSLAVAVVILAVIGWVRGGFRLAVVAVAVVGGASAATEVLKRYVLRRPDLVDGPPQWLHNSFPSGHTTVAMAVACATLLVVSWRWRTVAMLIVTAWTVGVGAYTVIARWHRLSDTLGADAIALLAASLGALYLVRRGLVRRVPTDRRAPVRTVLVVLAAVYVFGAGAIGVYVGLAGAGQTPGDVADFNLYLAAQTLASVGSVLTILPAWWSWHRLESA